MPSRKNGRPRTWQTTIERQMSELLTLQAWSVKRHAEHDAEMAELRKEWLQLVRRMDVVEVKLDQVIATLNEHTRILANLPDALQKRIGFQPQQE
ncbi:MAG: hypothetical protein AB1714_21820 [Acidobacteriota bacterium]